MTTTATPGAITATRTPLVRHASSNDIKVLLLENIHPEAERYRGYTQTHAWCELFFPSTGWLGFDPANRCVVADNFVSVAVGRDYYDVPPNKGIYRGTAQEKIDVAVHSEELVTIPSGLAAERMQSLDIPIYPAGYAGHREMVAQQQEHQQQ